MTELTEFFENMELIHSHKENPGNHVHFPSLAQTSCAALGTT